MRRSPHPIVRTIASAARIDPADWFAGDTRSRLAAREALARDRVPVIAEIRRRLAHADDAAAAPACALAAALSVVPDVEIELLALLASREPRGRAVAAAATSFGVITSGASRSGLLALLAAPDPRVRANALDALARRARCDHADRVAVHSAASSLASDASHRPRASAIRALLLHPAGAAAYKAAVASLGAMLADERPMHRIAGLWLAQRAAPEAMRDGWGEIASRVSTLWRDDPEPAVRTRAGRCATSLLGRMRSDWAARSAPSLQPAGAAP